MRPTGRMHSATLEGSTRLQDLLAFLEKVGAKGATAREIRLGCAVEAVSAAIDELRDNGVAIPWSKPEQRDGQPRKVYVYRLAKFSAPAAPPRPQVPPGELFGEVG
jgi:hypothetical protein